MSGPPLHLMYPKHMGLAAWIQTAEVIEAAQATPGVARQMGQAILAAAMRAARQKASLDCAAADMLAVFVVKQGRRKVPGLPVAA